MTSFVLKNIYSNNLTNTIISSQFYLGRGIKGIMPNPTEKHENDDEFAKIRYTLKNAWNTTYISQLKGKKPANTPFRVVNNSGDLLSRENYSCGGPCQTFQSRPGVYGLRGHFGAIQNLCDGTNIPPASCNVKYVADSSDYIRFKKNQAVNRNFNDRSFGGDDYSSSQSAYRAIRRY
uniref:Uncharacterized protein n=1 Tax=viral metagenome TaxID=1070528 RepID=A0A6C0H7K2_9ZZZZ